MSRSLLSLRRLAALVLPLLLPAVASAQLVQGQGATFPSKVYETWARAFEKAGGGVVLTEIQVAK